MWPITLTFLMVASMALGGEALPIVPGGHGFGMETPAGSGRHLERPKTRVIKVTNLDTDGRGSLRAALAARGPRVIVFEVGGTIDFRPFDHLTIRNPYVTVAGQTAPSPGITLRGCEIGIRTHDVLIQHIRVRVGDLRDPDRPIRNDSGWTQWSERDCMKVSGKRIVIDHCSFSWATDENIQSRASRVTFRRNMITECLNSPKHHKGGHSKGLLILDQGPRERVVPQEDRESRDVAVIGNLFAYNADRNPQASGGSRIAIINNLVYGATERPGIGVTLGNKPVQGSRGGGISATVLNNHYDNVPYAIRFIARRGVVGKVFLGELLYGFTDERGEHVEKMISDPWTADHMKIFRQWCGEPVYPLKSKVDEHPVVIPGLEIKPTRAVREWVLANAGARPADRDVTDKRVVRSVRACTGKILRSQFEAPENAADSAPPDPGYAAPAISIGGEEKADTALAMPEMQENYRELSLPENPHADDDKDGYTNLEEWLHGFAARVEDRE